MQVNPSHMCLLCEKAISVMHNVMPYFVEFRRDSLIESSNVAFVKGLLPNSPTGTVVPSEILTILSGIADYLQNAHKREPQK